MHYFKMVVLTSHVTCTPLRLKIQRIELYLAWSREAVKSALRLVLVVNSTGAQTDLGGAAVRLSRDSSPARTQPPEWLLC